MYGFSTVDGFVDVNEGVEEMIKYLANEPSVGLFFVQQHAQNAMPNVLNLTDKIVEKTHEMILHTEDLEDSICAVRSMTECGLPIVDEMVKDINKSLQFMSTSQPRRGLHRSSSRGFQTGKSSLRASTSSNDFPAHTHHEGVNSRSYLSVVFNSVKKKATGLRLSQIDSMPESTRPAVSLSLAGSVDTSATALDAEVNELPLSSQNINVQVDEGDNPTGNTPTPDFLSTFDNFEKFKSAQEAKLEEWLEEVQEDSRSAERPETI
uniref:Protein MEF2BNB n=1 Tax=Anthurium amnicola TaxID=1678845 RepID=A0A1D1YHW2_9ARAE